MIDSTCSIYENPLKSTFITAVIISVGIVISYIPQHVKIIRTRSSVGLSPVFLLLSSLSGIASTANLITLSFLSLPCCTELTPFECINSQISLIQVGLQTISTLLIVVLCVLLINTPTDFFVYDKVLQVWRYIVGFLVFTIIALIIAKLSLSEDSILVFAKVLGVFATIVAVVQYIPQLRTTLTLKHAGSLSIPMMCVQTPGGFIWTATLILKPGSNWSSWLPYLSAAILQGTLLLMCTYYEYFSEKSEVLLVNEEQYYTSED